MRRYGTNTVGYVNDGHEVAAKYQVAENQPMLYVSGGKNQGFTYVFAPAGAFMYAVDAKPPEMGRVPLTRALGPFLPRARWRPRGRVCR